MSVVRTLGEPAPAPAKRHRWLTFVLSYENLLADDSVTFLLDEHPAPLSFVRGTPGDPVVHKTGEVRVPDTWLSNRHASLDRRGDADVLVDEGSRNGTFVNGGRVTEHRLQSGDLIEVGHSLFCYRVADATHAVALRCDRLPVRFGPTVTRCPEVAALAGDLTRLAASKEPILLLGETGAGKEVAAELIHAGSGRTGAFATVDCGAVPESLFEATFFGHRRGAFTGASDARVGEIVRADRGSLFLDEVGNTHPASQAKLLRVIETGQVTPLGASEPQSVDVRWIAATNKDLFADGGGFRSDLLRRLAGYVGRVPPLRARREDLGALSAHLLRQAGIRRASISVGAARALFGSSFPGNIRQLRAVLRSAALLAGDGPILEQQLTSLGTEPEPVAPTAIDRDRVAAALAQAGGNVVRAAQVLAVHPRQLYRWIERFALSLDDFRR